MERQQISIGCEPYSQVQREVIAVSRQKYVVADHTKFRASAFVSTASFDQIDGVITTDLVGQETIEGMQQANLDLILA